MASCMITANGAECESSTLPNWLELPRDITRNILQRFDTIDIVTSACLVCPKWWNICKDPLMWRTIRMTDSSSRWKNPVLVKTCCFAIERSCGELEEIDIERFANNDLLICIAEKASNLRPAPDDDDDAYMISKTMPTLCHLDIKGNRLINTGLLAILDGCPLLESLDMEGCCNLDLNEGLKERCLEQIKYLRLPAEKNDEYYAYRDYLEDHYYAYIDPYDL